MPDLALDLRFLRYAVSVAEYGSFRRAAEVLNLSQSTVSRRVQHLERRLGVTLFERTRRGTKSTAAGERFLRKAGIGAEYLREAAEDMGRTCLGQAGELRLSFMTSLASGFLGDMLERYHRAHPNIDVRLEEASLENGAAGVLCGRLDAAFVRGAPYLPGCDLRELGMEPLCAALPRDHPLAASSDIRWEQLRGETFLVTADANGMDIEQIIARHLSSPEWRPRLSVQHVGWESLINMVGRHYGVALVAGSSAAVSYPGVVYLPLADDPEIVCLSVVWSKANANPALRRLLSLCPVSPL